MEVPAQAALTEAIKKRAQHEQFLGKIPNVGVYAEHWVTSLRLADSTIKGYRKIIRNHITPYLGRIRLDKLTATRIGTHYRELEKSGRKDEYGKGQGLSANTVNKVHVVLGAVLEAAIDDGLIVVNPAKKKRTVNAPKASEVRAQKPEIATWGADQLNRFLTWDRDELKDELFPLWRFIAYTGMRRSEALALKRSDINQKTGRVSIRRAVNTDDWTKTKTTKTGSARVIDVDPETLKVMASYKVARAEVSFELGKADAYVFGDDNGDIRSPDAMTSRWDRRLKKITALDSIYSHVTPTMQKAAANRFAAHLGNA